MDFKHKLSSEPGHDVVFLSVLALKATVGPETWHRLNRPQPVILDIRMRTNIALAGDTDDVLKTIHYGNLCKAVTKCVESSGPFSDLKHFAGAVCEAALGPGGGGNEIDLTVTLPKALLLAEGVGLSTVQISGGDKAAVRIQSQSLFVRDMKLACIIGVNPHERLEKQHIVINLIFYEITSDLFTDYAKVVKNITDGVEESTYETIEALATFIGRIACMSSLIGRVTVSVEKPKALIFVGGSGVEITRDREFYGLKRLIEATDVPRY